MGAREASKSPLWWSNSTRSNLVRKWIGGLLCMKCIMRDSYSAETIAWNYLALGSGREGMYQWWLTGSSLGRGEYGHRSRTVSGVSG